MQIDRGQTHSRPIAELLAADQDSKMIESNRLRNMLGQNEIRRVSEPQPQNSKRAIAAEPELLDLASDVSAGAKTACSEGSPIMEIHAPAEGRLVAWREPAGMGAERFRALAMRLDDMRAQHSLSSFQVTSSVINEGKSFVSANLAVTIAKYCGGRTILVEGDLHRPKIAPMFGLAELPGIGEWWSGKEPDLSRCIVQFEGMPLCFLPAGNADGQSSQILHSARFKEAFRQIKNEFDWVIVDSTPMLPVVDANLWSRLVDGTLLVVRQGVAPLKALRNGLQSLDRPNLIGVVVNGAKRHRGYDEPYYGGNP
jgi:capsular exopolysaccharide synthesis family protein